MSKTNLTCGDNGVKKSAFHNFKIYIWYKW